MITPTWEIKLLCENQVDFDAITNLMINLISVS